MKIVQFNDGKFGVRKGNIILGYYFLDTTDNQHWWFLPEFVNKHCHTSFEKAYHSYETAKSKKYNKFDIGKVVRNL